VEVLTAPSHPEVESGVNGSFNPLAQHTLQVVIVALLVMPMPSNKVRGVIQGSINTFWHSQEYVKKTSRHSH
jgi:hypothetical protein